MEHGKEREEKLKKTGGKRLLPAVCVLLIAVMAWLFWQQGFPFSLQEGRKPVQISAQGDTPQNASATFHVLDVGQGSCLLIEAGGEYMLVDGGDRDHSSQVVATLKDLGVRTLRYVIATHYHVDHLSGVVGALRAIDTELVLAPDYQDDTKTYDAFWRAIEDQDIAWEPPQVGATYSLGDCTFTILAPASETYEDENNYSIALRFTDGKSSVYVGGDACQESEAEMVKSKVTLASDVYVVNHHGSVSSSSQEFVDRLQPSYVIISAALGNDYGHPHREIMARLKETGAALFRTDLQGDILFYLTPDGIIWEQPACTDWTGGSDIENKSSRMPKESLLAA